MESWKEINRDLTRHIRPRVSPFTFNSLFSLTLDNFKIKFVAIGRKARSAMR